MRNLVVFTFTLLAAQLALAAPRGPVIVRRTGPEFSDVEWEVRGDTVEVKFEVGSRFWTVDELILVPTRGSADEDESEESSAGRPTAVAWHARCRFADLSEWVPVQPSSPLSFCELRHEVNDARLALSLVPAVDYPPRGAAQTTWVRDDLALTYVVRGNPSVKPTGELHGETVLAVGPLTVKRVGFGQDFLVAQRRFVRFGFEYVLSLRIRNTKANGEWLKANMDETFTGFSFLPTVTARPSFYSDFGYGFSIRRPGDDWEILDRPFEAKSPVRLEIDGGRAEIEVTILESDDDAATHVSAMLAQRRQRSRYYSAERIETVIQDGQQIERFQFEDFKQGGRKKLRFVGFTARLQGRLVTFLGISPLTDSDSRKLQEEVDEAIGSVRFCDVDAISNRLSRMRQAIEITASGFAFIGQKKYLEALTAAEEALQIEEFGLAYYLRAEAHRGLKQFEEFREDIERAVALEPDSGYDEAIAPSYAEQGATAYREKRYRDSAGLYARAYRLSEDANFLKGFVTTLTAWWNAEKSGEDTYSLMSELERQAKPFEDQEQVEKFLATTYSQGATIFMTRKEYTRAKRWARKLRSMDGRRDEGDKLYDKIRAAQRANRNR